MTETAILLVSHGNFAAAALEAAEMIVGKQSNTAVVSVSEDKDLDAVVANLEKAINDLDTRNGLLILVDIYGGTPCNASCRMLLTSEEDIRLLSGFNLPVLLEVYSNREQSAAQLVDTAKALFAESLTDLNEIFAEGGDDDGDQLG